MKKTRLGKTDLYVTPISFGVLTVGWTQLNLSVKEGAEVISYAIKKGINFFDTAQYYQTYPYLREALRDVEELPIICSKSLTYSYEGMEEAIKEALREMDLPAIDIFLLHEVRQRGDFEQRSGAWQCLKDYKKRGLIKAIGISTHHVDAVEEMIAEKDCDVVFPLINYAGLGIRKGSGPGSAEDMAAAIKHCSDAGKGIFTMKAFGGGNLTGTYQKALDYVFSLEGVTSVMVGLGTKEEVDQLVSYAEGTLPEDFQPDVRHKRIRIEPGNCAGCGACAKRCPNHAITMDSYGMAQIHPNKCLTCGYCAPVCPVRAIIMW